LPLSGRQDLSLQNRDFPTVLGHDRLSREMSGGSGAEAGSTGRAVHHPASPHQRVEPRRHHDANGVR